MTTVCIRDAPPTLTGYLTPVPLPAPGLQILARLLAAGYRTCAIRMWVRGADCRCGGRSTSWWATLPSPPSLRWRRR